MPLTFCSAYAEKADNMAMNSIIVDLHCEKVNHFAEKHTAFATGEGQLVLKNYTTPMHTQGILKFMETVLNSVITFRPNVQGWWNKSATQAKNLE